MQQKQTFKSFLETNLSYINYSILHEHLAVSRKMMTVMIENPEERFNKLQVEKLDELLISNAPDYAAGSINESFNLLKKIASPNA